MDESPQFGERKPGLTYRDRPCAFGLAFRDDRLALVWIEPVEALKLLRRDNHAWALACWLRRGVRDGTASQA